MITKHTQIEQGTQEWLDLRHGLITCSELHLLITPTLKVADNDKVRSHIYELAAQRITGHTEESYLSADMQRGRDDEVRARELYSQKHATVTECGFITREFPWGVLGYSPDALVGDTGAIECKSKLQKLHLKAALAAHRREIPPEHMAQVQGGMLAAGLDWLDFVSYCGGMPMVVCRQFPKPEWQRAIDEACASAEQQIADVVGEYHEAVRAGNWQPTERIERGEMIL